MTDMVNRDDVLFGNLPETGRENTSQDSQKKRTKVDLGLGLGVP